MLLYNSNINNWPSQTNQSRTILGLRNTWVTGRCKIYIRLQAVKRTLTEPIWIASIPLTETIRASWLERNERLVIAVLTRFLVLLRYIVLEQNSGSTMGNFRTVVLSWSGVSLAGYNRNFYLSAGAQLLSFTLSKSIAQSNLELKYHWQRFNIIRIALGALLFNYNRVSA